MAVIYLLDTSNIIIKDEYLNFLEEKRKNRILKCSNDLHKKELLGAGLLLNKLLKLNNITEYALEYNEYGKPFLKDKELYFSISHSNNIVGIIISKSNIGIDLEVNKIYNEKLITKVFNEQEKAIYAKLTTKDKHKYFYEVWTGKEAYVKYVGTGLKGFPKDIILEENVIIKEIVKFNQKITIAACGVEDFKVDSYNFDELINI